jgi:ribosomal-protein-alanine N-acetyltransferase
MAFDIGPAKHDNISDILRIEQSIEHDYPANRHILINRLEMFPDGFLVANNDGQVIGYIESCIWHDHSFSKYQDICHFSKLHNLNGSILFVVFIGVDEKVQKNGIGSLLLNELMTRIKKKYPHIQKIQLVSKEEYVNSFYQKNGFLKIKRLPDYMPEYPGILMEYRFE